LRENIGAGVQIVAVELNGIAAALGRIDRFIPAAADAEVIARGDEMDKAIICCC
jgi:hypothetical protein